MSLSVDRLEFGQKVISVRPPPKKKDSILVPWVADALYLLMNSTHRQLFPENCRDICCILCLSVVVRTLLQNNASRSPGDNDRVTALGGKSDVPYSKHFTDDDKWLFSFFSQSHTSFPPPQLKQIIKQTRRKRSVLYDEASSIGSQKSSCPAPARAPGVLCAQVGRQRGCQPCLDRRFFPD